jgi:mRNA interferase RelE/StbE
VTQVWQIIYSQIVIDRDIPRLDSTIRQRIRQNIEAKLCVDPIRFGKPLRFAMIGQRSLRVGDYRVLYLVDSEKSQIQVLAIGHRRNIYDD